jgi:prephenate dehydratase
VLITYLGPEGTFTEAALRATPEAQQPGAELRPEATVIAALDAVRSGEAACGFVPFENSVEGAVTSTLDELATGSLLQIRREVLLPIRFALLVRPGATLADIATVSGHPHSQPQCRGWLKANLPQATWRASASNSDAAREVAAGTTDAALAGAFAAPMYGLDVLVDGVQDRDDAVTRFVLVTAAGISQPYTGADRTTLVAFELEDHPGALLEMLTEFAVRGVNLTRLESRPTGEGLGRYCFSIDCEGHVYEERVGDVLKALHRLCADVRFLGSYPRADGTPPTVRRGTSDGAFLDADGWLSRLRKGDPGE